MNPNSGLSTNRQKRQSRVLGASRVSDRQLRKKVNYNEKIVSPTRKRVNSFKRHAGSTRKRVSSLKNPRCRGINSKCTISKCQEMANRGLLKSTCPNCMKTFESEKEIMETKLKQCKETKAHYRNKMKKIQTRLRKTKTKSCKHQLKTIEYERSNSASKSWTK